MQKFKNQDIFFHQVDWQRFSDKGTVWGVAQEYGKIGPLISFWGCINWCSQESSWQYVSKAFTPSIPLPLIYCPEEIFMDYPTVSA